MKKLHGFTLIELVVTMLIIGIIAAASAPSFMEMIDRSRVKGAAEDVYAFMVLARNQALKQSRDIGVYFDVSGDTWAYGMTDVDADRDGVVDVCDPLETDASQADACTIDDDNDDGTASILVRKDNSDYLDVTIAGSGKVEFDYVHGKADSADTLTVTSGGYSLSVIVSPIGRARICSPGGDALGYKQCS